MKASIHFISGLPRSGSTLLSALLRQNPRFHAGMTGPMASMIEAMVRTMSMNNETSIFLDDQKREAVLRGLFATFYEEIPATNVVFDTSRLWCAKLSLLASLFPNTRVVCCVRDLADIYDSIERLVRKNKFQPSGMFNFEPAGIGGNVFSRAEHLADKGIVGHALSAFREAFYGEHSDRLLVLTYRTLTERPKRAIDAVYEFVEERPFAHDYNNVVYNAVDFDRRLGTPSLHDVRRQVKFETRKSILPPELIRRFSSQSFWQGPAHNPKAVKVV